MGLGYTILRLLFNPIFTRPLTKKPINWFGIVYNRTEFFTRNMKYLALVEILDGRINSNISNNFLTFNSNQRFTNEVF